MKYSIILPYYNRPELRSTLLSFVQHYSSRKDYEVIIVEDVKNFLNERCHSELMKIFGDFRYKIDIRVHMDSLESFNPSKKYNHGFKWSKGEYIILSSPEVFHRSNVLQGFDELFSEKPDRYYVCSCLASEYSNPIFEEYKDHYSGKPTSWYQHSLMRNKMFHFCSGISRENFIKVGGFDERYCKGIGFDDESFIRRVGARGIKSVPVDELVTIHIEHDRSYHQENLELIEVNRELFLQQLASNDFTESFIGAQ